MKILVLHEKHGDRYFLFGKTQETEAAELQAIALKVFTEREEEGWYEVEDIPKLEKRYYEAAKKGDAKAALTLMQMRSDWEYEGFDIESPEDV
jgi:hypothetical protein